MSLESACASSYPSTQMTEVDDLAKTELVTTRYATNPTVLSCISTAPTVVYEPPAAVPTAAPAAAPASISGIEKALYGVLVLGLMAFSGIMSFNILTVLSLVR